MSNTVAGRRQLDNSQECIVKKRQWRRHANENTPDQNASILIIFSFPESKQISNPGIFLLLAQPCGTLLLIR